MELSKNAVSQDTADSVTGIMSEPWITISIRLRPDQITKFQELYPEKALAPTMRMIFDTFIDGKKPTSKRKDDVKRLREKLSKQLDMLDKELEQLDHDDHEKIMLEAILASRKQYLETHPQVIADFNRHDISTVGYRHLQKELKCSSRQQVDEILKDYLSKWNGNGHKAIQNEAEACIAISKE